MLRLPEGSGPSPAVVLLHGCGGGWRGLDERWGKLLAELGLCHADRRPLRNARHHEHLHERAAGSTMHDAYRALDFLVGQSSVDPSRVAMAGFSQGAMLALLSVERGQIERSAQAKFRAAIGFYPPCLGLKGNMTVPTLILIGELDDWAPAKECRNLAEGRDDWGISREKGQGIPIEIIVYPGAHHDFDVPNFATPVKVLGHHLEFNEEARDQAAVDAVRKFLNATIGGREKPAVTIKAIVFDAYGTLYDVQSVADVTEDAFPGYGDIITQVWRIKQLEYTWLRSLMRHYRDFSEVTRDALAYTLDSLGLEYDDDSFARIIDKYLHLDLYPDALAALSAMKDRKLAILSNGSPDMLDALVRNSGLDQLLDAVISVDAKKTFKPSPEAYMLIEEVLHVPPSEVLFISSNPWDACGAKAFGLNVAWIERVTPEAMALACLESETLPPLTMFWALRTQMDELGVVPDHRIHGLAELPALVSAIRS